MHIKSMCIDGFKSYGQRTEVSGFDPAFNAITGLNGSGKSNILDAICFLLGITNLSHVRATNLQELVYKNGQAGVTKATVSVTFDNRNKKQSPLGYEHYDEIVITRQVVIGGKNKYLINGTNFQNNRVQDLFRSVQLNVNNPHFLIMQGRITKVLNMKPPEILAMIEEAVGTMMYESKKQQAQKTIEKKDAKLKEINDILNEEITPQLAKLKEERSTYLEFQKIQRELEHLTKLYIAFRFISAEETSSKLAGDLDVVKESMEKLKKSIAEREGEMSGMDERIAQLQKTRDEELGGRLQELEEELKMKEKDTMKAESSLKQNADAKKQEEKKKQQIIKGMTTDKKALDEKEREASGMQDVYDNLRMEDQKCSEALKAAQKRYEAISMGKFTDDSGESATLQQMLMKLKSDISSAQTTVKTCEMKLKHDSQSLKTAETKLKKYEKENASDATSVKKYESEVERATTALKNTNYVEGSFEESEEATRSLKHEVNSLKQQVLHMGTKYPWLDFQYSDPEPRFDRRKVHGVAAKLFTVKDPKFCVALDTAGGGKLTNVVVDTADVAAKIIKRGQLARRAVMLPLDKMTGSLIPDQVLKFARSLVPNGNMIHRAIDLIEFDNKLTPAMNFIFGSTLVCSDLDVANKVAFHPQVQRLCVTLDGDKVNPSGELSGGAPSKQGSTLQHVRAIMEVTVSLEQRQNQYAELETKLGNLRINAQKYNELRLEVEAKSKELDLVRERLKNTEHHRLNEEVQQLGACIEEYRNKIEEAKKIENESKVKHDEIEFKIKNADQLKKKELKEAESEVKRCKKAEEVSKGQWNAKEAEEASLKLEISELKKTIEAAEQQLSASDEAIKGFVNEDARLQGAVQTVKAAAAEAKEAVKSQKEALQSNNREINTLHSKKEKLVKANQESDLEIQELSHKINKAADDAKDAQRTVKAMLEKYEWIPDERKFFGQPNSAYDFKATNPKEAERRIQKLEETKGKMEKTVNMRAMNMLGKAEEQYHDLMRKKTTVENDKAKIKKVIEDLDIKKREEIRQAWDKVNKDFGSIFSTLLPGTRAKLQPPEGMDVIEGGLEVKVAFGDVWKDSLTELSGGQRSLVALSLILSLLLFRPAPLYILDEVDAALDLSHTQNIGHMLKTHFKHSQFIVVSLKDGMFNNANVLFRTKFVDGMSTVSRTTQVQKK